MILIITHKEDYTCDYIIDKLNEKGISYYRFNCEDIGKISYIIDADFSLSIDGFSNFTSVWFRRTKLPDLPDTDSATKIYLINEFNALFKNILCLINAKWLSNPFNVEKAENKLFQLFTAKNIGFLLPKTLLTNTASELKEFYFANKKNVVIKPLSVSKIDKDNETEFIFTNQLKSEHVDNIEEYDLTPCIYQEEITKAIELRITVVGNKTFSVGINSQESDDSKTDWRKGNPSFFPVELPYDIEQKCLDLVKNLGLQFGAIDMIKTSKGEYYFLEINPNGQWVWIETETGLKISDAIINYLI